MKKKILFILMGMSLFVFGKENSVTAITEVFGEGQKTTAVILEYDKKINSESRRKL